MKDLLSKEHYCYKIYTLLVKSSAHSPYIDNPLDVLPPPPFLKVNPVPPFYDFSKISVHL